MQLDWVIIGGGLHGVHLAARLIGEAGVAPEALRIVDPAPRLLARWRACTSVTGMQYLRSPSVHHLDLHPNDLRRFAQRRDRSPDMFTAPYDRPSLSLFNTHCDQVIERFGLDALHVQARATACTVDCDAATVTLSTEERLQTRNVVLAVGASDQPRWPAWAPRSDARVQHIFDPRFTEPADPQRIAVVGGGISAGQVALRLAEAGHTVHLIARHALRKHQFDSDPGWLGPRFMADFERERDHDTRRRLITQARHAGSVTPGVFSSLQRAVDDGRVTWHLSAVDALDAADDSLTLRLTTGEAVAVDQVFCATGFEPTRPGGDLVDALVALADLPCASCGYPIVDAGLRWHPRVRVSGPLAELELGPSARNIAGARRAGDRVVRHLASTG